METGFIRITTVAANKAQPVAGANIFVRKYDGDTLIFEQQIVTDFDGYADAIEVETPPRALSLLQENTVMPYATYDVYGTADGYLPISVKGVQVFSGETSLLSLNFVADSSGVDLIDNINSDIVIPVHTLFDSSGGSSAPPVSLTPIPRVLPQPIIPRKIKVHLGAPNDSASDVEIDFIDYVKNVASSEIYPTWPEECLKANIHAQISIALNRIYTEWYLSKGYPFDITGSPSYDQKYLHGRDIYNSVSVIADDIFNTYLRKNSGVEPFFAEYCDGNLVTCPGMKQWGSKDLAEAGYSAIRILRYYYGNDVDLYTNNNIQSVTDSYPGTALRVGSSGESVRTIQRQLNRITQDYPAFDELTVDGNFGIGTETTVKQFQRQFSLTADGVVGKSTWYKISYIYVSVKDLAQLTTEGEQPTGEAPEGEYGGTALRVGSTGEKVAEMQYYLQEIAQFNSAIPSITSDGIFGNATEAAVEAFQSEYGLSVDGIVGPQTWDEIYSVYSTIEEDITPPGVTDSNGYPGTALRQGDQGVAVKLFQFWLSIISYKYTSVPKITADGDFGAATEAAVRAFQSYFNLTADGIVGPVTWNKLFEVYIATVNALTPPNNRPGTYPGMVLRQGDTGIAVKEFQFYLFIISAYYTPLIPQIEYDGLFGAATETAVRAFQKVFSLSVDGLVGPTTWEAIYVKYNSLRDTDGLVRAFYASGYPGYDFIEGATGRQVEELQYRLFYIAQFFPTILEPSRDGVFGASTKLSVMEFQRLARLPVTGAVDEATWNNLFLAYEAQQSSYNKAFYNSGRYKNPENYPMFVLKEGSLGAAVLTLQQRMVLIASRYCMPFFVPENGIYDVQTADGVLQFQLGLDIPQTGIVDRLTWEKIFSIAL